LAFSGCALLFASPAPGPSVRTAMTGGLLLGLAPLLREESFLLTVLVAGWAVGERWLGADLLGQRARPALLGLLAGTACVASWNLMLHGHPLGMHALTVMQIRAQAQMGRALAL